MKKLYLLSILSFLFFSNLIAQTEVQGGEVSGIWDKTGSPYIINGDITVNGELKIDSGVEVLFKKDIDFKVYGKLIAEGTKNDSINFKNYATNTWRGIQFVNSNKASLLKYFKITGVRNLIGYDRALTIDNSNQVQVSHGAIFNNSSENISASVSLLNLNNITISNLLIYGNSLYNETGGQSIKWGLAFYIENSFVNLVNLTIVKNSFSNSADQSGTTVHIGTDSEVTFTNCIIQENGLATSIARNTTDPLKITNSNIYGLDIINGYYDNLVIGEGNYDEIPNFVDFDNDNFAIQWADYPNQNNKPREVDGGTAKIHDTDGSISDIGAIHFDQSGEYFESDAWFDSDKTQIQVGTSIQFINNSQKGSENIVSYLWDFGDGTTSNEYAPSHTYTKYGKYDVSLTVTDAVGNTSVISINDYIISGTIINGGNISGVWDKSLNPYIVKGNLVVPSNKLLEIKQGVNILFSGHYNIVVNGDLSSVGTENEPVNFTAIDTVGFWDTAPHVNYYLHKNEYEGWNGIRFQGQNTKSKLKYSNFSYRKNYGFDGYYPSEAFGGTILIVDNLGYDSTNNIITNFPIENCRFFNNNGHGIDETGFSTTYRGAGINAIRSNVTIKNCIFEDNKADYAVAVYIWASYNSKIIGNTVRNNNSLYNSGKTIRIRSGSDFTTIVGSQILIKDNIIENNSDGGIFMGVTFGDILIEHNLIDNNLNGGIETHLSTPIISRNTITNNIASEGAGIKIGPTSGTPIIVNNFIDGNHKEYYWGVGSGILCNSNSIIINNTITNNYGTGPGAQAVFADNATLTAINNIVYNNPDGAFAQNNGGGIYPPLTLINNFESDPLFVSENIPELSKNSPCIDTGTMENLPVELPEFDFFGNPRVGDENKIDIGAVEFINYDIDNDGVLNVNDLCPDTPQGSIVDDNGCLIVPVNNFSIETVGETCPDKNNAQIIINTLSSQDYSVEINGTEINFTDSLTIDNLIPATYNICISIKSKQFEQCFILNLPESSAISAKSSINDNSAIVKIDKGTPPYNVFVNGRQILHTYSDSFHFNVKIGDLIEVKTNKTCEGVFTKLIGDINKVVVYPNPTYGTFNIVISRKLKKVPIELYNAQLQLISKSNYNVQNGRVSFSLKGRSSGIYILKVMANEPIIIKVIKK
jgi:PKD repeat protein